MKAIIYTPEELATIKEIRRLARNRYFREYRKKKKTMKDYEQLIKALTPERKIQLWWKVKDLNFSNATKYRMIYYKAIAEGYITK